MDKHFGNRWDRRGTEKMCFEKGIQSHGWRNHHAVLSSPPTYLFLMYPPTSYPPTYLFPIYSSNHQLLPHLLTSSLCTRQRLTHLLTSSLFTHQLLPSQNSPSPSQVFYDPRETSVHARQWKTVSIIVSHDEWVAMSLFLLLTALSVMYCRQFTRAILSNKFTTIARCYGCCFLLLLLRLFLFLVIILSFCLFLCRYFFFFLGFY